MNFLIKCQIILEFAARFAGEKKYINFFVYNDLGIPLAVAYSNRLIKELSTEGMGVIEETWIMLCEELDIDPDEEYENLDDILQEGEE